MHSVLPVHLQLIGSLGLRWGPSALEEDAPAARELPDHALVKVEEFGEEEWLSDGNFHDGLTPDQLGQEIRVTRKVDGQTTAVRPIQMGEVLRKYAAKRLLRADKVDIDKVMTAMRQFGCGLDGGAEAIQHFFQAVDELFREGKLTTPIVRVKIDDMESFKW